MARLAFLGLAWNRTRERAGAVNGAARVVDSREDAAAGDDAAIAAA